MNMKVKIYNIYPNKKGGKMVASMVVNISGLVVNGVRIMSGSLGQHFVAYPSFKMTSGQYKEIIEIEDRLLDREVREEISRQYEMKTNKTSVNPFLYVLDDDKLAKDNE